MLLLLLLLPLLLLLLAAAFGPPTVEKPTLAAFDLPKMFVLLLLVDLVSLNVCQHCSCTSVHILCTPANVVTSALAQVFSKTVIHGIESNIHSTR